MLRSIVFLCCSTSVVSACLPDKTIHDCLDIAKHPENYREFGRCSVNGELEWWKSDYIVRANNGVNFVFMGDIEYVWADPFSHYVGERIEVVGRYQLLENEYPSIIEIERVFPPIDLSSG